MADDDTIAARAPSATEVIGYVATKEIRSQVRTCVPAVVQSYDAARQEAQVQPAIRRRKSGDTYQEPPIDVPVVWPQVSGYALHMPLKQGDPVLLLVCERSLDDWLLASTVQDDVTASDPRRYALQDAVALAGVSPFSQAIPGAMAQDDALTLGARDGSSIIRVADDGGITIDNGSATVEISASGTVTVTSGDVRLGDASAVALAKAGQVANNLSAIKAVLDQIKVAWDASASSGTPVVASGPLLPYVTLSTATTKAKGS